MENPGGEGGANQNVFRGGGMDIFWNHTFPTQGMESWMAQLLLHALPSSCNDAVHCLIATLVIFNE